MFFKKLNQCLIQNSGFFLPLCNMGKIGGTHIYVGISDVLVFTSGDTYFYASEFSLTLHIHFNE